jgi:dipeptidyl aminopeptidase/acylaminoacyl peptidase
MRSWWGRVIAGVVLAGGAFLAASATNGPPALERYVIPANMTAPQVSPAGTHAAFVRYSGGKLNLVICALVKPGCPTPVTKQIRGVGVRSLQWVNDDRMMLTIIESVKTEKKSEVISVWGINKDLTREAVLVTFDRNVPDNFELNDLIVDLLPEDPVNILAMGSESQGAGASLFRVNVYTGEAELVARGQKQTISWATDREGVPRVRWDYDKKKNKSTMFLRQGETDQWEKVAEYTQNDFPDLKVIGITDRPHVAVVLSNRGSDRIGVYEYDMALKTIGRPLFLHPKYDIGEPLSFELNDEHTGRVVGVSFVDDFMKFALFDSGLNQVQSEIQTKLAKGANAAIVSWSQDRKIFVAYVESATDDGSYHLYSRESKSLSPFGKVRPQLRPEDLSETKAISYKARDGVLIPAYLTLPRGKPAKDLPLVVSPHGGPWARDYIGFDWMVQALASRGYAVLQMNFRGSSGYGKAFLEAGNGQWGLKMQDDVTDGVMRMIADGTVDPDRVCILGASYGGYSALAGGALTPDLYKCVISVSGVSDLPEMLEEAENEYGRKSLAYQGLIGRVGDRRTDRKALAAVSPSRLASQFTAPVLLIHGSADDVAPIQHSKLMYNALLKSKKGVRFVEIPNEGHDIQSPRARLLILQEVERFLRAYIGDTPTPTS